MGVFFSEKVPLFGQKSLAGYHFHKIFVQKSLAGYHFHMIFGQKSLAKYHFFKIWAAPPSQWAKTVILRTFDSNLVKKDDRIVVEGSLEA